MSLQAALKNVSVPDFVRRCARAAGDALPDGLLDGFNEEDFARALFARMALGGAPQPEEPPAPAGEADEPAPDPDAGKHAFEVFCDCLMLDENLIAYLIDVLKANDRAGFYKLSQVTTHLDLDPDEFLYWLAHREDYAETDEERACAVILDACLDRLRAEGQMDVAAALLSGDRMTFDALRCEAPVSGEVLAYGEKILETLRPRFAEIDARAEINQAKVLAAMQKNRVNATHFAASTGYGYDDEGRDNLERVYADAFHTEAALVRPQITCGTHALAVALSANLLPGDELLAISGKPYDTLEEVIGIRPSPCSLAEYGVSYRQIDLLDDGSFDLPAIRAAISAKTKLIHIQRSKGYQPRPTLSVAQIGEAIAVCRAVKPDVTIMVDNCYGEFVETVEPSDVGADMIVGSLIKNPGGGLAPIGGYIAGTQKCVDRCAYRLSAPGLGQEVGANLGLMPSLYQGFFLAPNVVSGAVKGAVFTAAVYESLGFRVVPAASEERHDIIQCVELKSPEGMLAFCKGIQSAAPVDSYVDPVPGDMPGYDSQVIMAAGAFVQGSSIDGPIRPPFAVYYQGGLTWYHAKLGVLLSLQKMLDAGLVTLP